MAVFCSLSLLNALRGNGNQGRHHFTSLTLLLRPTTGAMIDDNCYRVASWIH